MAAKVKTKKAAPKKATEIDTTDCTKARNLVANMELYGKENVTVGHVRNFQRYVYDYASRVGKEFITKSTDSNVEVFRKK